MMNKKRVRFLKKLIYAFIIIVLFLPLILMSLLTSRMISVSQAMQEQLKAMSSAFSQSASSAQSAPQDDYVLEPEDWAESQDVQDGDTIDPEPQAISGIDNEQPIDISGVVPENSDITPAQPVSDTGEDIVNGVGNNALNKLDGNDAGGGVNPETGANQKEDPSPPNYNGNPGMGR